MSMGPGRSVSINLSANAAPYIASIRAATLATGQLSAQLRAAGVSSVSLAGATTGTTTSQRAASAASAGQSLALRAQAAAATAATASTGRLRNAQGQFVASAGAATAAANAGAVSATRLAAAQTMVGKALLGGGVALAALAGAAAFAFAKFDQQMSQLRSVSGATAAQMRELSAAAIDAGAKTVFSAREAAQAQTELAKAGVSTADILGGALTGSLSLAAAGNLELGRAAEVAGQAMNIFNLRGSEVERVADALANGANKSAADVDTLAQSLAQGGLVAAQTGLDLEDTVGVLALFADNALMGSDAGTSLKTMLQRLTPQSAEARAEMERLGFSAFDASGEFIGITALAGQLQSAFAGMSTEQRNASMQILFGSDAVRAASVLYQEGAAGVAEYVAAVSDSGAAARVAAIQLDNLAGDFEELKGALETGLIQSGSAFNDILRDMVQAITGVVNAYNGLDSGTQGAIATFVALAAIVALLGGAALTIIPKIAAMRAALTSLGVTAAGTSAALSAMAGVLAVVGAAWAATEVLRFSEEIDITEESTRRLARALGDLDSINGGAFDELIDSSLAGADAFERFGTAATRALSEDLDSRINRLGVSAGIIGEFNEYVESTDAALAQMVASGNVQGAADAYDRLIASIEAQNAAGENINVDEVAAKFTQYQGSLDAANSAQQSTRGSAEALYAGLTAGGEAAATARSEIGKMIQSLAAAGLVQLSARDAARGWEQAIDDATAAVAENGVTLDRNTQAGRDNEVALDAVAKAAIANAQAIYDATGSEEAFRQKLIESKGQLVATAIQFGHSEGSANEFADSVLNIPAVKSVNFATPGLSDAVRNADILRSSLRQIGDVAFTVTTRYVTSGTPTNLTQRVGTMTASADGNIFKAYAGGGVERHVAQIAPAGAWRVWAEPETGGEAYIPLSLAKRSRSLSITRAVAESFGYALAPKMHFADGALVREAMSSARAEATGPVAGGKAFNFNVKTERTWTPAEALQLVVRAESMYGL